VAQLLKTNPPVSKDEGTALVTDTTALDGGTGLFAPPKTPAATVAALQKAVEYAIAQPGFKSRAAKANISDTYESAADQTTALNIGMVPATIDLMRKFVPLHTGIAS
jgi:tripartite-type tricarboxylate transporter receptor subunit TctC